MNKDVTCTIEWLGVAGKGWEAKEEVPDEELIQVWPEVVKMKPAKKEMEKGKKRIGKEKGKGKEVEAVEKEEDVEEPSCGMGEATMFTSMQTLLPMLGLEEDKQEGEQGEQGE